MSSTSPFDLNGGGFTATATLERDTLQYWFASLGQAHQLRSPVIGESRQPLEREKSVARHCPHPDRCRFIGCEHDCQSPLPAA